MRLLTADRSWAPLVAASVLVGSVAWVHGWNCQPDVKDTCQVRAGPSSNQNYTDWVAQYHSWRAKGRAAFDFQAYDTPGLVWARTSFVQAQVMVHDRFLYNRVERKWTVDKYIDDVNRRYGGVDSVLLWHFYPNAGIDARNAFDWIESLPGGKPAIKQVIADFHRHGVKVMWPFFPWDVGTNPTGKPQYVSQVEWMAELGADGFNGDTLPGINASFWAEESRQHVPLAMEPELMGDNIAWNGNGLATNVMSRGYWPYQQVPVVDAFKTLEPRHLTHICERWARNRTDGLHHAFFNGIGYESWENVWGIFNKISPFHAELLRRMATILRAVGEITSHRNTEFNPHVPYTCAMADGNPDCSTTANGVYMSEFKNDTMALYTIINRNTKSIGLSSVDEDPSTLHLSLPCKRTMRLFNLHDGKEFFAPDKIADHCHGCENDLDDSCMGRIALSVKIEALGIGAVLSLVTKPSPPEYPKHQYDGQVAAIENLMKNLSKDMRGPPLSQLDKTSRPLQQTLTANPETPLMRSAPPGMVTVPRGVYAYESINNCIEGDRLADAVGVQMPWQKHPSRRQRQLLRMQSFHIDKHLVTNEQYRQFIDRGDNRYFTPHDRQNWLKDWPGGMIPSGASNHPVRWVSRTDAQMYCRYYDKRLPTSWEWQYAAQGTDGRRYPWGNDWNAGRVAKLSNARTDPPTENVDAHPDSASPFGAEDMVGHVYQWTDESCDEHTCRAILRGGSQYYPMGSPWYFPQPGCIKGGCREDTPRGDLNVHNTLLLQSDAMDRSASIGFRCVVDAEPPPSECVYQLCGNLETRDWIQNATYNGRKSKPGWSGDMNHDLTAEGSAGWITWGPDPDCLTPDSPEDCVAVTNEKRGFRHVMRASTLLEKNLIPYDRSPHTLTYSDGVGPVSSSNVDTGAFAQGALNGFRIQLPTSVNKRTVAKLYVCAYLAKGEMQVMLNDGETEYLDTSLDAITSMASGVYTIEYQTVDKWPIEARWSMVETYEASRASKKSAVGLQAVTLSVHPIVPPKHNSPPGPPSSPPPAHVPKGIGRIFDGTSGVALAVGGVLVAGFVGVLCGRRCVWKKMQIGYELDDWSELEESLGFTYDGSGASGSPQQDEQMGNDHWFPSIEPTHEPGPVYGADTVSGRSNQPTGTDFSF